MTLTIIFTAGILIGVAFIIWGNFESQRRDCFSYCMWRDILGITLVIACGIALLGNLMAWIPSKKDSEIKYQQLQAQKYTVEQMLDTDQIVDRILLNEKVIEYNNEVIEVKTNSQRFIYKDYYSKDVDWDALEIIEWE